MMLPTAPYSLAPLVRCVVEPPCKHCWYCQKANEKR